MKNKFKLAFVGVYFLMINLSMAQLKNQKIGAYYFDGWSGTTFHITDDLKANYPQREPVWGWVTSTQKIVDDQIKLAADAGLSFFSFCWYYPKDKDYKKISLNQALKFYKASPNVKKMEFCLLVANHAGFNIGPKEWAKLKEIWVSELDHPQQLKVDGKPLLIFFEYNSLVKNFGSAEAVKKAFEELKQYAVTHGLPGISIAICAESPEQVKIAEACGADLTTGYNYHTIGFEGEKQAIPIKTMQLAEQKLWGKLGNTNMKYIPVSTVGWDPRPWSNPTNQYSEKPYYIGFSAKSVKNSVQGMINWMRNNPSVITKEQIGLLYAWNENGEGSWLTPGKLGLNPLKGVQKALKGMK